jgi:hypothetical protein
MPMREPKPKPPSPMQQKKLDKMMAVARGKKVDPMDYLGPNPKYASKGAGPSKPKPKRVGPSKPKQPSMPKRVGDLREMGPRKPPAKTMPKQMGPKKAMKPKQMKMKRMGY